MKDRERNDGKEEFDRGHGEGKEGRGKGVCREKKEKGELDGLPRRRKRGIYEAGPLT